MLTSERRYITTNKHALGAGAPPGASGGGACLSETHWAVRRLDREALVFCSLLFCSLLFVCFVFSLFSVVFSLFLFKQNK